MLARSAATAVLIALAGCAGMESAGRSARTAEPTPVASAPPPTATPAPAQTPVAPPPPATEPAPAAPPPAPTPAPQTPPPPAEASEETVAAPRASGDVVVPGARQRQVQPPGGDPRSNAERMQDIRAWDQCVMRVQSAFERDPMRPQLQTPEEYCRQSLGMADRTAVPASRLE